MENGGDGLQFRRDGRAAHITGHSVIARFGNVQRAGVKLKGHGGIDRELSSLYSELRNAVVGNSNVAYLRSIGITTSYKNGLTTLTVDEAKLTEALESDLDGVRDAFTGNKAVGSSSDGIMTSLQDVIDRYASTTGATKGILIEKAGSKYSPTASLDNTMLNKMEDIDEQIARWQEKMTNQVDYYTSRFTKLEVLINQMNSQSSALAGLTGGY